ncbi:MAG: SHOCT domain-containing protein, partial [Candidatus Nitrotoga sp.]
MNLHLTLRNIFVILLSLCLQPIAFAASPPESNERLTEQKVLSFMKTQIDAYIRGDAAAFVATLADDYTSTSERQGGKSSKSTRGEVEASLAKNLPLFSDIQINHEDKKINISQDGLSASVSRKEIQKLTMTMKNVGVFNVNMTSLGTSTFELRGGKIVTTSDISSTLEQKVSPKVWNVAERPTDCTYFPEDTRVAQYDIGQYHSKSTLAGLFGMTNPVSFCRLYKADAKIVSAVVQSIVPTLGNPIRVVDVANGVFTTDTMERNALLAKWQDSYSITVQEAKGGDAAVRILRPLSVYQSSRRSFEQNESDGYNEQWILSQITERLASGKYATTPPSTSAQPAATPAAAAVNVEDQLKKLQDMLDKKIISDQEYKAMRAKALGL